MILTDQIKKNFYWLPSSIMIISALLKFFHFSSSLFGMFDVQNILVYLGAIELISVIFFLFRPTMLIGFFLICTFWGGVISASIIANVIDYLPVGMLFIFGLSLYWRDPTLFIRKKINE